MNPQKERNARGRHGEQEGSVVEDLAVVGAAQSVQDDRWAGGVAAQPLDALGQAGGQAHGCVQREAVEVTAEQSLEPSRSQRACP